MQRSLVGSEMCIRDRGVADQRGMSGTTGRVLQAQKKDGMALPSFRREYVEPGGSEGTTSITHPDASLRVSFTNCQKKGSPPQTTPCSTYSKKVFRGLPRQQVVKNTQITAIGRANHSGAICPAVQGGRQKKGEVPPPPPNSTHCPLTG